MSIVVLNNQTIAQVAKTLNALAHLTNDRLLPDGLAQAIQTMAQMPPTPEMTKPVFSGMGEGSDVSETLATAFSQMNRTAYLTYYGDSHSERIHDAPPVLSMDEWRYVLNRTQVLVAPDFISSDASTEQSNMFRYLSQQLSMLSESIACKGIQFHDRLTKILNDIASESAIAAFQVHPSYDTQIIHPSAIADDLIQLAVHSNEVLMGDHAFSDIFTPLDAGFTQGSARSFISTRGVDVFTHVLSQYYNPEWVVPTPNAHSESPVLVQGLGRFAGLKYKNDASVPKPNSLSVMRVIKAVEAMRNDSRFLPSRKMTHIDGRPFSIEERIDFKQSLAAVSRSMAYQHAEKTLGFTPKLTYKEDSQEQRRVITPSQVLYVMGDINNMPRRESLDQLTRRVVEMTPEVVLDIKKQILPGFNSKSLDVELSPKFGIDGASLYEMANAEHYGLRDRLTAAIQELVAYANVNDMKASFVGKDEMPAELLSEIMQNVNGVKLSTEFSENGVAMIYEKPEAKTLSVPNGQDGEPVALMSAPIEWIRESLKSENLLAFTDLNTAQIVMSHVMEHEPSQKRSFNFGKMLLSIADLGKISDHLIRTPERYLMMRTMQSAIQNSADVWGDLSDAGRTKIVVDECLRRDIVPSEHQTMLRDMVSHGLANGQNLEAAEIAIRGVALKCSKVIHDVPAAAPTSKAIDVKEDVSYALRR